MPPKLCNIENCNNTAKWKSNNKLAVCDMHKKDYMKISSKYCCISHCYNKFKFADIRGNRYCTFHKIKESYSVNKCYIRGCQNPTLQVKRIKMIYCYSHDPNIADNPRCYLNQCNRRIVMGNKFCNKHVGLLDYNEHSNKSDVMPIKNESDLAYKSYRFYEHTKNISFEVKNSSYVSPKKLVAISYCDSCDIVYTGDKKCCGIKRNRN